MLALMLVLSTVVVTAQSTTLPVDIEHAEIDGTDIFESGWNQLNIERNDQFTLKLELLAWETVKNVEIFASIDGYEYSDVSPISDRVGPLDLKANVTYVEKLKLKLPDDVDRDDYKLRVRISDRNSFSQTFEYDLQVDAPRHSLKIIDVSMNPGSTVKAGSSLLSRVRVENKGQRTEHDIKVSMNIPSLDVSASNYISDIKSDKEEETEEMFLRLPKCAAPGTYDANVVVTYNKGHDKVTQNGKVTVLENDACKIEPQPVVVVQQPVVNNTTTEASQANSGVRTALEIVLLVLIALLIVVGVVIGFTRMREE